MEIDTATNMNSTAAPNTMDDIMMEDAIVWTEQEHDEVKEDNHAMMAAFLEESGMVEQGLDSATAFNNSTTDKNTRQVSDSTRDSTSTSTGTGTISTTPANTAVENTISTTPPTGLSTSPPTITGRPSIPLYLSCNPDYLSEYQCLIRKYIELFEATPVDVAGRVKGRNKPIVLGQVGIRCFHCAHDSEASRAKGNRYYPHALVGIYQAAQILSQGHFLLGAEQGGCPKVDPKLRGEMQRLKLQKSYATAGKDYWANTAKALSVYEDNYGLRFEARLGVVRHTD